MGQNSSCFECLTTKPVVHTEKRAISKDPRSAAAKDIGNYIPFIVNIHY